MKFSKQHYVTASYLKEWCDPKTPDGYTPFVWLVSKDGQSIEKRSPANIFNGRDFYTVFDENGNRNLELEHYLHKIEDNFLITRRLLQEKRPFGDYEFQSLVMFIASTYARTKLQKREQKEIWRELLNNYQELGIDITIPNLYKGIEDLYNQPLPYNLYHFLRLTLPALFELNLTIITITGSIGFITSDNPVLWIDPSLWLNNQPISFMGIDSPSLEIILPISPRILVKLSRNSPEEYLSYDSQTEFVDIINNIIVQYSDEFVVMNHDQPNPFWFKSS